MQVNPKPKPDFMTCKLCGRTFPFTLEHFYRCAKAIWEMQHICKLCVARKRYKRFKTKQKPCIICDKLFLAVPAVDGRYRDTCSKQCLRKFHSIKTKETRAARKKKVTTIAAAVPTFRFDDEFGSSFNPF